MHTPLRQETMTPIPITFTRQPPDCGGLWLHRHKGVVTARMIYVPQEGAPYDRYVDDCIVGGEWAGPLIVNENEPGEDQEGKVGT